ncbi:MAG: Binding-protein-dependent transport systems inner membrane component [Thermotoga sp. 50_1627]|uniref:ABC transporter permease n=1 Tax=Pseudothermotoga sp. TaxID=2033661 RepID=UPI00076BEFEA|nr:MAG: Binding-protein-dependent transport systems inner membrane component [Thermotoga sp. 50_64]KUK25893.1 MAG: Binding-protein-dependent transport systems inner membrane component [Thermotoga sp. 50_1627]MBC7116124.1 ABC transporter permease [Pseudothermotoga sp.]MDK2922813.1 peptide/nickel transport system permease protein [Pseudothermotoga sp.]HBT38554.1 ABC transporter permease [Pseudothermotoga sp.]
MKKRKPNFFRELFRSFEGTVGFVILCVMVFCAVFAPLIAPYDPYDITQRGRKLQPPSPQHIMGTDWYGVDIFSQIVYGARTSLTVGALTAIGVSVIGGFLGVTAATFGKGVDVLIMRIVDFVMVLPGLPIMIMIMTYLGSSFWTLVFVLVVFGWAGISRVVRAIVLSEKKRGYVEAAVCAGASKWYILKKHLLPAAYSVLVVNAAFSAAGAMLAEAGLSFLGFSDPRVVSWGKMLSLARTCNALVLGAWWWILFPGLAIFLASFSIMSLGVASERILNPKISDRRE